MLLIIGLIILFNIIKIFNSLAMDYKKTRWKWTLIALATYYGTLFFSQLLIGVIYYFASPESFDYEGNFITPGTELAIGIATIPLGLLACYLLHRYLEKRWKKEQHIPVEEIDSIGE